MPVFINGSRAQSLFHNGKSIASAFFNGRKVFSKAPPPPSVALIPNMTSNSAPAPFVVSCSQVGTAPPQAYYIFSGAGRASQFWNPIGVTDIASVNAWIASVGNLYIIADLGAPRTLTNYSLWSRNNSAGLSYTQVPGAWTILVSPDGTNYTTVDSRAGISSSSQFQRLDFPLSSSAPNARFIQMLITELSSSSVGTTISIGALQFYGY